MLKSMKYCEHVAVLDNPPYKFKSWIPMNFLYAFCSSCILGLCGTKCLSHSYLSCPSLPHAAHIAVIHPFACGSNLF